MTDRSLTLSAPAKINLYLGVHTERDDRGYHRVDSLMAAVGLSDSFPGITHILYPNLKYIILFPIHVFILSFHQTSFLSFYGFSCLCASVPAASL